MCHQNPQVAWDKPVCRKRADRSKLSGTEAAKALVSSSFVGSGGKSYELPLTIVVGTGCAGLSQARVVAPSASIGRKEGLLSRLIGSLALAAHVYDVLLCSEIVCLSHEPGQGLQATSRTHVSFT